MCESRTWPRRWAWGWAGLCLALLGWLMLAPAALAGGLIVSAGPAGEAGLQTDAAVLSPRPSRALLPSAGWQTYRVQPGDTLAGIAARLNVELATLAATNSLANVNRIEAGQLLRVAPSSPAAISLPADGPLVRVQLWPWPPVQGQTLVLWLRTRDPISVSLSFAGEALSAVMEGRRGWSLIPISPLAAIGSERLAVGAGGFTLTLPVAIQPGAFETHAIPASASDPILSEAARVQAEFERMTALYSQVSAMGWTPRSRFRSPLAGSPPRTATFGSRRTYGASPVISVHLGEDFAAAAGAAVRAPAAGRVVLAEQLFVRGNAVVLDHGRGVFTGYWHLQALHVKTGDAVTPGQLLGEVGSTGLSTGPHLHWEMRVRGAAVDPLQWVEGE